MSLEPHPDFALLSRGMARTLPLTEPWQGIVYRSTSERYANAHDLISGEGAMKAGGRFNPPGAFLAVYGCLSLETAMEETLSQARYYGFEPWTLLRRVFCAVEVDLQRVLDLTRGLVRQRLRVSRQRMVREDWRRLMMEGHEALTQALGRAAFEAGLEGLLVPSAARREGKNLLVLPACLEPGSTVREVSPGSR